MHLSPDDNSLIKLTPLSPHDPCSTKRAYHTLCPALSISQLHRIGTSISQLQRDSKMYWYDKYNTGTVSSEVSRAGVGHQ
jgi:hypothetical protein